MDCIDSRSQHPVSFFVLRDILLPNIKGNIAWLESNPIFATIMKISVSRTSLILKTWIRLLAFDVARILIHYPKNTFAEVFNDHVTRHEYDEKDKNTISSDIDLLYDAAVAIESLKFSIENLSMIKNYTCLRVCGVNESTASRNTIATFSLTPGKMISVRRVTSLLDKFGACIILVKVLDISDTQ